jgi:hypothetical protein
MWSKRIRSGCANALFNSKFEDDYFFNRASVSSCSDPAAAARRIAKTFLQKGFDCYLHDSDHSLAGKGFDQIDTMYVLGAGSSGAAGRKVVRIDRPLLPVWIGVFCRSYSVHEWKGEVERIMNVNFDRLGLWLSYDGKMPAGCAALYCKNGIAGLYCLGTVSQLRKKGLANDILATVAKLHDDLFLQTLGSEGLLPFFEKAGLTVVYTKRIYMLRRTTKLRSLKKRAVK